MTFFESSSRFSFLFEHDLFRKPLHTFRDHALVTAAGARRALEPALHPRVLAHATSPPRSDVQPADKLRISRQFVSPALRRPSRNRAIGLAVYGTDCLTHATDRAGCSWRRQVIADRASSMSPACARLAHSMRCPAGIPGRSCVPCRAHLMASS